MVVCVAQAFFITLVKIMKERPILFSADMVNAILAGNKTQTRRIIKPQPNGTWARDENTGCHKMYQLNENINGILWWNIGGINGLPKCKYGQIGDHLWVRETFHPVFSQEPTYNNGMPIEIDYAATYKAGDRLVTPKWKPSIHMPRHASRILLEITDIRIERLNDISENDAIAEGIEVDEIGHAVRKDDDIAWGSAKSAYAELWERINGECSWSQNPFVWVISFKRI